AGDGHVAQAGDEEVAAAGCAIDVDAAAAGGGDVAVGERHDGGTAGHDVEAGAGGVDDAVVDRHRRAGGARRVDVDAFQRPRGDYDGVNRRAGGDQTGARYVDALARTAGEIESRDLGAGHGHFDRVTHGDDVRRRSGRNQRVGADGEAHAFADQLLVLLQADAAADRRVVDEDVRARRVHIPHASRSVERSEAIERRHGSTVAARGRGAVHVPDHLVES